VSTRLGANFANSNAGPNTSVGANFALKKLATGAYPSQSDQKSVKKLPEV
jgi:hypothetical protein